MWSQWKIGWKITRPIFFDSKMGEGKDFLNWGLHRTFFEKKMVWGQYNYFFFKNPFVLHYAGHMFL